MGVLRVWMMLSWLALATVMFGAYSLLRLLNRGDVRSPFQVTWFRAGHAHAPVLLLMSLLYYSFLERTGFSSAVKQAVYITFVEHPARLSCGIEIAAAEWAPSYKRATVMQGSLALTAGLCGVVRGVWGGPQWFWAAILILAVVPYTLFVVRPTNVQLLHEGRDRSPDETLRLLQRWGRLHAVRGLLGAAASILFVWAATD
jgi:hypothetical protein